MIEKEIYLLKKEAEIFKAFSHHTRLMIIKELLKGEKCVSTFEELLELKQSNVSQHLNILRQNNIVDYKTEGKNRCYFLKDLDGVKEIFNYLKRREK